MPKFPDNVKSIINYDENIKAISLYLGSYCNVPNQKVIECLDFLSNSKIKMSQGNVGNILKQFGKKSEKIINTIKQEILKSPVINEDETPITVNGKIMSSIGVFTKDFSLIDAFENRKLESFEEMGILDRYIGTVCHDHNKIHQSFFQSKPAECNFHILRYCKAEYEIHKRESIKSFMDYLLELRDKVEKAKLRGLQSFNQEEYEKFKIKYLKLLDDWDKEFL